MTIYSFDVFDTLITRHLFKPTDLFLKVANRLSGEKMLSISEQRWCQDRMEAEARARELKDSEEITFADIKEAMLAKYHNKKLIDYAFEVEQELELEYCCRIESKCSLIESLRSEGHKVIAISDMYHSRDFIEQLLRKNNILVDSVYVSSEFGLTKDSGSLYHKVAEQEKVKLEHIVHVGDNKHSDYISAKKNAVVAEHYSGSLPSNEEKLVYGLSDIGSPLIRSVMSGVMRSTRLANPFEPGSREASIWAISSNMVAPLLTNFVYWVLKSAKINNIECLYFVARDGWILHKIARQIVDEQGLDLEVKYLYGSRQAWHAPSQYAIGDIGINWIFDKTTHLSLANVFSRVNMEAKDYYHFFSDILQEHEIDENLDDNQRDAVKRIVANTPELKKAIIDKSEADFLLVAEYLKQQGFSKDKTSAIIDVGWHGRLQKSLSHMLEYLGLRPESGLHGFYVGLTSVPSALENERYSGFLFDLSRSDENKRLNGYETLLEHFLAADHGSTIGYSKAADGKIEPVLRCELNSSALDWGLEAQADCILAFAKQLSKEVKLTDVSSDELKDLATVLLFRFTNYPTHEEATTYGAAMFFEDQNETIGRTIVGETTLVDLFAHIFLKKPYPFNNFWMEGAIAQHKVVAPILLKILDAKKHAKELLTGRGQQREASPGLATNRSARLFS